jgi:hypothetical protein
MRKTIPLLAAALLGSSGTALAQLPLNTGYNHGSFAPYAVPATPPSTIADNYWIKIASYEPPSGSTTVSPAFVLNHNWAPWAPPMTTTLTSPPAASAWIGPRPVATSSPGTSSSNPAYSLFRKCFCLMRGFTNPRLSFQIRADDNVQVWLNSVTQTLVGPILGNQNASVGPARSGSTQDPKMFREGRNCLYVLLEDNFPPPGHMGFNLAGAVSANGLMPVAGAGVDVSFAPCQCPSGGPAVGTATAVTDIRNAERRSRIANAEDDSDVVQAILRIAEARRLQRTKERPRQ